MVEGEGGAMPYTEIERQDAAKVDAVFEAINQGEFKKARALAEDVVSHAPEIEDYEPWWEADGVLYERYWDESERDFYADLLERSDNAPEVAWLPCVYPKACFALGFIDVQEGDVEAGLAHLIQAAQYDERKPHAVIEMAVACSVKGDYEMALEAYDVALDKSRIHPPWIAARILRGKGATLAELGRLDEALAVLEESLKYEPTSEVARGEVDYISALMAGHVKPVPGRLTITNARSEVSLPGQPSVGIVRLLTEVAQLNEDGVITPADLAQAETCLLGEPQILTPRRLVNCRQIIQALREMADMVVSGEMDQERFDDLKAEYLQVLCISDSPAAGGEVN
jgi:tetratricopeptide (TPR) repeat protein